jgi:hypothetical protein
MIAEEIDKSEVAACAECKKPFKIKDSRGRRRFIRKTIDAVEVCSQLCQARWERSKTKIQVERKALYTIAECDPISGQNLEGKILVLRDSELYGEYKKPQFQLWKATSGFGCNPHSNGTCIYSTCCADGTSTRFERYDFIGILKQKFAVHIDNNSDEHIDG